MTDQTLLTFLALRKDLSLTGLPASSELLIAGENLQADAENLAAAINAAARIAQSEFLIVLPPDLVWISGEFSGRLRESAKIHPNGAFYYTDYFVRDASGSEACVCV
jgi:hypothetical protein